MEVWEELARISTDMSAQSLEQEKRRGPLMAAEFQKCNERGLYEEYVHPAMIKDPVAREEAEKLIRAAEMPKNTFEQIGTGGGEGKVRIYRIQPYPGSELFEIVSLKNQILRKAAESAAAAVLPYTQTRGGK